MKSRIVITMLILNFFLNFSCSNNINSKKNIINMHPNKIESRLVESKNDTNDIEEVQIYSKIINSFLNDPYTKAKCNNKKIVIDNIVLLSATKWSKNTKLMSDINSFTEWIKSIVSPFYKKINKIPPAEETINDFWNKNIDESLLPKNISLNIRYQFITTKEYNNIFYKGDEWENFYKKYPKSQGVMTFSKIGFNKDKTQAIVCFENADGEGVIDGISILVLYEKIDNNWNQVGVSASVVYMSDSAENAFKIRKNKKLNKLNTADSASLRR